MPLPAYRTRVVATTSLFLVIALASTLGTRLVAAVDCVGKPYGTPGCPLRPASSSSSSSSTSKSPGYCGNAIVDAGEQCDKGRFNGKTDCSRKCTVLSCGDGVVTKDIGEECDPVREEVYVQDKNGNLTIETRYASPPVCGWYCQPPTCTEEGTCSGGCKQKFFGECAESSASLSAVSTASGSTSPVGGSADTSSMPSSVSVSSSVLSIPSSTSASSSALSSPAPVAACGDGIVQEGEECDRGQGNSDTQPNACRTSCTAPTCGDGIVDKGEQCDGGETCGKKCKLKPVPPAALRPLDSARGAEQAALRPGSLLRHRATDGQVVRQAVSASSASKRSRSNRRKATGGTVSSPSARADLDGIPLPVVLGAAGVVVTCSGLLFRTQIVRLFRRKEDAVH